MMTLMSSLICVHSLLLMGVAKAAFSHYVHAKGMQNQKHYTFLSISYHNYTFLIMPKRQTRYGGI
jgi:hypothetical protein